MTMHAIEHVIVATLGALLLFGCQSTSQDETRGPEMNDSREPGTVEELFARDREYCAAVEEHGVEAWAGYYAEDGAHLELGGKFERGPKEVLESDAEMFADPSVFLFWEPENGGMFADGNTGFTTGPWRFVKLSADGDETVLATGKYVTVWRRDADGWKVILDTGAPDPPPGD